ncbi:type II CRISPR RNA-guided endonuclease Cas9 [Thermophagus xiamenensis]|uniref:CRISPR-associated endonuclease Cas9 n=1 Tax=Thermophagus xiamenensis TaxID=385682 RepID=A0A1I2A065_9BACT|nr:type II CRISPR RNA-guided endonuclease Cas9 [Thermophagus xiamenensis]SFE37352.1 CRISPR-associated endonuclease Csn1 [Thermophagus xiamenensis]
MKRILGLDLGTNSIGWALVENDENDRKGKIIGMGSRIIPMDMSELDNFNKGASISKTAERTRLRMTRRLRERHLLRRARLHRILNIMGFLPEHYRNSIDFIDKKGCFFEGQEPKIAYKPDKNSEQFCFLFTSSFHEMLEDFRKFQPELIQNRKKVPYDWTIYYLRKKALTQKISKEELAWIILNFNTKRGYYHLRGEDEDNQDNKKIKEFRALKVVNVTEREGANSSGKKWYDMELENGWVYSRQSNLPPNLEGKTIELIVSYTLDNNGNIKKDKNGKEKYSLSMPGEEDWNLVKIKTENDLKTSKKSVGEYIYDHLLKNPDQKIRGKLISTIERKFYKEELSRILKTQMNFYEELKNRELYQKCVEELYPNNKSHQQTLLQKDFIHLIVEDIIFYQRPLKSKRAFVNNCPLEYRVYVDKKSGELIKSGVKCIPKSHPLFQEFRLWQYVRNLRIYERERMVNGRLMVNVDVTNELLPDEEHIVRLFDLLNDRKSFKQDDVLRFVGIKSPKDRKRYSWNYPEDKELPGNETRHLILAWLKKVDGVPEDWLDPEKLKALWHLLYSVTDREEIIKGLHSFAKKYELPDTFVEHFKKIPRLEREYGSFSEKAIKKLLPLMRMGKYWKAEEIPADLLEKAQKIIDAEADDRISDEVREKLLHLKDISQLKGLPLWQASYLVYGRHSETGEVVKWRTSEDLEKYILQFKQHSLRNPVVEQVILEALRVVKDIWEHYGEGKEGFFNEIHVEIGRELKNPADKRKKITSQIQENENTNLRIKALLEELFNDPSVKNVRPYSPAQQEILRIYEDGVLNGQKEIPDDILKISKMARPSKSQLVKYKLWLEQKYRSPYTGEIIPLSQLFTSAYEIEHIIPQARYFDDSFSNKVICEAEVNREKGHQLAFEFITKRGGDEIELNFGKKVTILNVEEYQKFVKDHYGRSLRSLSKMRKLLMEDIPDDFIDRQLNDSRYISKVVRNLLSNIVRAEDENSLVSKHLITCTGGVTTRLKHEWGLNDVWNELITPRFVRLNKMGKEKFGEWINKKGKQVFQIQMPLELQKGFNKKRIDHRHHALDALVVACASRSHVNYLNNDSARANASETRYDLRNKLCYKDKTDSNGNYRWKFYKPWESFTEEAKNRLAGTVVSFKSNRRIMTRSSNRYFKWVDTSEGKKKKLVRQIKGDNQAIRKPLHKDTVLGKVSLRKEKKVSLSKAIDLWESIVDKPLKKRIQSLREQGYDKKLLLKYFKDRNNQFNGQDISRVNIYFFDNNLAARRVTLDASFNSEKRIDGITDSGIKKILYAHLQNEKYHGKKDEKGNEISPYELAFSPEGLEEMNANIKKLNGGKPHCPIYKVRLAETIGEKFKLGEKGNKNKKYVEAAKGTNLFFAVYVDEKGVRSFETIPFSVALERRKQKLAVVPEENENKEKLLFYLSPNDLVYVPDEDEKLIDYRQLSINPTRIYKMVSSSGTQCFFIPHFVASPIVQTMELGPNNKSERAWDGQMIKNVCYKLSVDRLGNVKIEK